MSKKLYLYKDGNLVVKMAFGDADLPILKSWYEKAIKTSNMPEFKDLHLDTMNNMAKTVPFGIYRLRYCFSQFKKSIKNSFRWN